MNLANRTTIKIFVVLLFWMNSCHKSDKWTVNYHVRMQTGGIQDTTMIEIYKNNKQLFITLILRDYMKKLIKYDSLGNISKNLIIIGDTVDIVNFENIYKLNNLHRFYGLTNKDTISIGTVCNINLNSNMIVTIDDEKDITKEVKLYNESENIIEYKIFKSDNRLCKIKTTDSLILKEYYKYDSNGKVVAISHVYGGDSVFEQHLYNAKNYKTIVSVYYDKHKNTNYTDTTMVYRKSYDREDFLKNILLKYGFN